MRKSAQQAVAAHNLARSSVDIVCAYVGRNHVLARDLPDLITKVQEVLYSLTAAEQVEPELVPAVSVGKSITPDRITCFDCGKDFKSLRRHLGATHDMGPETYRTRWGLPADYPMVSPNYSAVRSQLARKLGLRANAK